MLKGILEEVRALDLLACSPVTLVTSAYEDSNNIITISWSTPASFNPPIISIVVGHSQFSHYLIENSREFAINIPDMDLLEQAKTCGSMSGHKVNKFYESGLTEEKPLQIKTPLIKECFANIECQVFQAIALGDHTIFCGKVVSVLAVKGILNDEGVIDLNVRHPIMYIGHNKYFNVGNIL